ncbi:phosphoribosylanthranilate isomerase, partial [Ectothiorhodospiraceae bacterium WFHF3C12]|nr:phosphoribosylanthranilate isomerase [Ectothiorhodospiraceae bacterium WFHF3C12]
MRTRVKICGLTREADLAVAVEAGADAVGLVFHRSSPRFVDLARAEHLCRLTPAFVTLVGLFLDEDPVWVEEVIQTLPLDLLQFHGTESPDYCQSFGRRYIKALGLGGGVGVEALAAHPGAAGVLLDGHPPGQQGGSG